MTKELRENLTNYIMSVQSLVDRLHIMEKEGQLNYYYLNKKIEVLESYEDNINKFAMLLEELEEGYLYYKGYRNVNLRIIKIKKSAIQGNLYFCSQEIKKIMQDRIIPYL